MTRPGLRLRAGEACCSAASGQKISRSGERRQEGRPEEDRQFHPGTAAGSEAGALRQPAGPAALGGDASASTHPAGRPGTQRVLDRGGQLVDGLADEPWCAWAGATSSAASFLASAGAPSARWERATSERHGAVVGLGLCRPVTRRVTKRNPLREQCSQVADTRRQASGKHDRRTSAGLLPGPWVPGGVRLVYADRRGRFAAHLGSRRCIGCPGPAGRDTRQPRGLSRTARLGTWQQTTDHRPS